MNKNFKIGNWYTCSCNTNLYRFGGFNKKDPSRIISTGIINPTGTKMCQIPPNTFVNKIKEDHCLEYFNPNKLADMDIVNQYLYKFKKGDWVKWSGDNPVVAKISRRCFSWNDSWALDCQNGSSHTSCSEENLRHATPDEIRSEMFRRANRPIFGHSHRSMHNDHVDAMNYAIGREMHRRSDSFFAFKNPFSKEVSKPKFKEMQITKTETIEINGKERVVTIVVLNEGAKLKAGYSVCMPQDKVNEELGNKIALGRAKSPKTNLVDMELGKGLDRKFVLYVIAEDLLKKIERGIIEIKGVK